MDKRLIYVFIGSVIGCAIGGIYTQEYQPLDTDKPTDSLTLLHNNKSIVNHMIYKTFNTPEHDVVFTVADSVTLTAYAPIGTINVKNETSNITYTTEDIYIVIPMNNSSVYEISYYNRSISIMPKMNAYVLLNHSYC